MLLAERSFAHTPELVTQLPVHAYFDHKLLLLEEERVFNQAPQYAGHSLLVPKLHDFCVLPHRDNGAVLVHNERGIQLLSNVCRHRQATVMQGRGSSQRLSCPLHRWTYDGSGSLVAAPRFEKRPCTSLENFPTKQWNGLQFTGRDPLNSLRCIPAEFASLLSFDGLRFGHMEVHACNYNWKTFAEFYLEDYHVAPFHPGLGRFVSCDELHWSFGEDWSLQTVGLHRELTCPGESQVYRDWHQAVLRYYDGRLPKVGAMWFMLYPNIMIEWYPLVTVVSTVYPRGPLRSVNVVEYYHPVDLDQHAEADAMAALASAAYLETAMEDNQIGERMQEGRYALMRRGKSETGPYHQHLEAGMVHFHRHLRNRLGNDAGL